VSFFDALFIGAPAPNGTPGASLASISDAAVAGNINPKPQSGRQEMLENLVNRFV